MTNYSVLNLSSYPFSKEIEYLKKCEYIRPEDSCYLIKVMSFKVRKLDDNSHILNMFRSNDKTIVMIDGDAEHGDKLTHLVQTLTRCRIITINLEDSKELTNMRKYRTVERPGRISCTEQHASEQLTTFLRLEPIDSLIMKMQMNSLIEYTKIHQMTMTGLNGLLTYVDQYNYAIEINHNYDAYTQRYIENNFLAMCSTIKLIYETSTPIIETMSVKVINVRTDRFRLYETIECKVNDIPIYVNKENVESLQLEVKRKMEINNARMGIVVLIITMAMISLIRNSIAFIICVVSLIGLVLLITKIHNKI